MRDLASGRESRSFATGLSGMVLSIAISPDGRTAISGCDNNEMALWDIASGRLLHTVHLGGSVNLVAISPDGRKALSASDDYMQLWDISEWTQAPAASAAK